MLAEEEESAVVEAKWARRICADLKHAKLGTNASAHALLTRRAVIYSSPDAPVFYKGSRRSGLVNQLACKVEEELIIELYIRVKASIRFVVSARPTTCSGRRSGRHARADGPISEASLLGVVQIVRFLFRRHDIVQSTA